MRRWLLGGFALFALGAALPAEIRECLPVRTTCAPRPACPPAAEARASHCPLAARSCPTRGLAPDAARPCRLNPTPPARAEADSPTVAPPAAAVAILLPVPPPAKIDAPPERPRARLRFVSSPARPPEGCRPPPVSSAFAV